MSQISSPHCGEWLKTVLEVLIHIQCFHYVREVKAIGTFCILMNIKLVGQPNRQEKILAIYVSSFKYCKSTFRKYVDY